jgi:sulfatase maturation enzyme AslB (radical SAM superfamily)
VRDTATTQNLSLRTRSDRELGLRGTKWWLSLRSLKNAVLNRLFLRAVGKNAARLSPETASLTKYAICTTNTCNANCTFCAYQFNTDRKVVMDKALFERTVHDIVANGARRLSFSSSIGDPLVDGDLPERIRFAKQHGIEWVMVTTNGILLGRKGYPERLAQSGCNLIEISSPGLDAVAYERVYRTKKFRSVLDGLKMLAAAARSAAHPPRIELLFRIDRPLEEVLADPGLAELKTFLDDGTIVINHDQIFHEMDNWSGQIRPQDLTGTMVLREIVQPAVRPPCKRVFRDFTVMPDGGVRACNCRYLKTTDDELIIGNLIEQPAADIMFGERHRNLVRDMCNGNWPKVCAKCSFYEPHRLTVDSAGKITV